MLWYEKTQQAQIIVFIAVFLSHWRLLFSFAAKWSFFFGMWREKTSLKAHYNNFYTIKKFLFFVLHRPKRKFSPRNINFPFSYKGNAREKLKNVSLSTNSTVYEFLISYSKILFIFCLCLKHFSHENEWKLCLMIRRIFFVKKINWKKFFLWGE